MGSVGNKYRVHEVAKDFGVPTKQITEILTKYAETPKNHMQVLGDRELSLIFESLTQHNQVSGIQAIYADAAKPAEKKAEPARQQPAARKAEAEKKPGQQAQQPQRNTNRRMDHTIYHSPPLSIPLRFFPCLSSKKPGTPPPLSKTARTSIQKTQPMR